MRKAQKQQAEELVKQIEEAHDQIRIYMQQGSIQSAMELLEDCQNGGITIGTLIEEIEGEGHPTVLLLEEYCELIYQIHTDLAEHKEISANKVYKLLRQKLIKAGNSLRNDIPIRKEIVFLPYKASMWDSLESVWKAADADPNCDAYVIPIPYYDKNPDGSFRKMYYEGDQYPDYIPVTKYDEFDFEVHRPDVIYIHNPYDDFNLVTSVPPFFFSKNLKKYTDELVYIPYFILSEIKPDEDEKIEGMKHFCTTPGVFHADKVIVQSEDMKQVYIKVLLDATNNHSEAARKYWNDKILGLGSPKLDKVVNTKKEDLEVPEDWMNIIQKTDGSWKKIVFYNTSVGALLQHNEKMLEKMQYVFDVFKENREEVALLWRPHPLIKATVESMRPQLLFEYDRLVRKYWEEGWGIYDDSSDIDRAIVLSDAYYGDGSSVVQMYQKTGKPIMIQNHQIIVSQWNEIIFGKGMVMEGNNIWIPMAMLNVLVKVNRINGQVEKCIKWNREYLGENRKKYLFTDIVRVRECLYLSPTNADTIIVYNIKSDLMSHIKVEISSKCSRILAVHSHSIMCGEDILFVGMCNTNMIGKLNLDTQKIQYFGKTQNDKCEPVYGRNSIAVENEVYIPLLYGGNVLILDIKNNSERIENIDKKRRKLITISEYNHFFYFTTEDGQLIEVSSDLKEVKEIKLPGNKMFFTCLCEDGILWLFPYDPKGYGLKIELDTYSISKFQVPKIVYNAQRVYGSQNILLNARGCAMELDVTNRISTVKYHLNNNTWKEFIQMCNGRIHETYEDDPYDLRFYLEEILDYPYCVN